MARNMVKYLHFRILEISHWHFANIPTLAPRIQCTNFQRQVVSMPMAPLVFLGEKIRRTGTRCENGDQGENLENASFSGWFSAVPNGKLTLCELENHHFE